MLTNTPIDSKVTELMNTKETVKWILENDERARNNDKYLIKRFYEIKYPGITGKTFGDVLGLPITSFETIRRARQKVQEQNPDLKRDSYHEQIRKEQEAAVREFARS